MARAHDPSRRAFLEAFAGAAGCFVVSARAPFRTATAAEGAAGTWHFPQGVASGDPTPDSVMLWTRCVAMDGSAGPVRLTVEVARDPGFATLVATRQLTADVRTDHTVRVLVDRLEPDTAYHYRFRAGADVSDLVGRTRTAPAAEADRPVRFAFASCQAYEGGYYGAWRTLLNEDERSDPPIDFVVHLGDFVYEALGYGAARRVPPLPSGGAGVGDREAWASTHAVTVDDYRHLYKTYLSDPDLRAARARWPFVVTWDDHEFSNDCWQGMATYRTGADPAQRRKVAANQAWFEYIPARLSGHPGLDGVAAAARDFRPVSVRNAPARGPDATGLDREPGNVAAVRSLTIYRSFRWGRHVDLLVTDTRSYRSQHCIPDEVGVLVSGTARYIVPLDLVRLFDAGREALGGNPPATVRVGDRDVANPRQGSPPGTMLGAAQKAWFMESLRRSRATWKLWANSVPAMPMRLDMDQVREGARPVVFTIDTWDGYLTERTELLRLVQRERIGGLVSLAGDNHNMFAGLLAADHDAPTLEPVAVEFATAGISSQSVWRAVADAVKPDDPFRPLVAADLSRRGGPGEVNTLNLSFSHGTRASAAYARSGDLAEALAQRNPRQNPHLRYVDSDGYGVTVATASADRLTVEMLVIARPLTDHGPAGAPVLRRVRFDVPAWRGGEAPRMAPPTIAGEPPFPLTS